VSNAASLLTDRVEISVVAQMLVDVGTIPFVAEVLAGEHFEDPRLGRAFDALNAMYRDGRTISLTLLADELARGDELGRLDLESARLFVAQLDDATRDVSTTANVLDHARLLKRLSYERKLARLIERIASRGYRDGDVAEIVAVYDEMKALGDATAPDIETLGISGDALLEIAEETSAKASPLPGLMDTTPSLHLAVGRPKTGKTRFACYLILQWAAGFEPWPGAPPLPGTDTLIISAEQSLDRVAATLVQLAGSREAFGAYADRVHVVALSEKLPRSLRALLNLDERGLRRLRQLLATARRKGRPIGLVVLDSLSRLKPADADENDANAMTALLDALAAIAAEFVAYVVLVHHVGLAERNQLVTAPRGSSSIAAVAQAIWRWEVIPNQPRLRLMTATGNAIENSRITFEVAPEDDAGKVLFFLPVTNADGGGEAPRRRASTSSWPTSVMSARSTRSRAASVAGGRRAARSGAPASWSRAGRPRGSWR